jgi:hypothetical protein
MRVEVKLSQARVVLFYNNIGPASLTDLQVTLVDTQGFLRSQLAPTPSTLNPGTTEQQIIMVECMKPIFPGPSVSLSYIDIVAGDRSVTFDLPLLLSTFNEPLALGKILKRIILIHVNLLIMLLIISFG